MTISCKMMAKEYTSPFCTATKLFEEDIGKTELALLFLSGFPEAYSALSSSGAVHSFPRKLHTICNTFILIFLSKILQRKKILNIVQAFYLRFQYA